MAVGSSGTNTKRIELAISGGISFATGFSYGIHYRHTASATYRTLMAFATTPTGTGELTHSINDLGEFVSWHNSTSINLGAITADVWNFFGMSILGTAGTRYHGLSGSTSLTSAARTMTSFTIGEANLLCHPHFDTEPFNGYVAGFWVVGRAISSDEMAHYSRTLTGPRDAWVSLPCLDVSTAQWDASGNSRSTVLGSAALDSVSSNPPVDWGRAGRRRLWFVPSSSGVSGTVAATTPVPTLAATGTPVVNGTVAATTPLATLAAAGTPVVNGTVASTTPLATLAAAGTTTVTGTVSATTPLATLSSTGTPVVNGTVSATTPVPTLVATGSVTSVITGTVAATTPVPALAARGGDGSLFSAIIRETNGTVVNLTTATLVEIRMRPQGLGPPLFSRVCEVVSPAGGGVNYSWGATDTTAGVYDGEFVITWADGRVQRLPNYGSS